MRLKATDEALHDNVVDKLIEARFKYTATDRDIKKLGVENGERAKFVVKKLDSFDTNTKKKDYLKDLRERQIVSDKVFEQIKYLLRR